MTGPDLATITARGVIHALACLIMLAVVVGAVAVAGVVAVAGLVSGASASATAAEAPPEPQGPYEGMVIVLSLCRDADGACVEIARPWERGGQCYADRVGDELDRWRRLLPDGYGLGFVGCRVARRGA